MKDRAEFLLEIGCEEIPAGMIAGAARELKQILEKYLSASNILDGVEVETFGAPRRLVASSPAIRVKQEDVTREIIGPPKSIAFDNVGEPTRAAESFAQKQAVPLTSLYTVQTSKGEYLAAKQLIRGRTAPAILSEILPQAILEISWPRSMYWESSAGPRFIRPIRWLLALLEGKVIPFAIAGVKAGNVTSGHRFLGKQHIIVTSAKEHVTRLRKNFVLARPEERRQKIEHEIRQAVSRHAWRVHTDTPLLELVTYLNEYPTVIVGDFNPTYLQLPDEILITVMRDHQKYFAVEGRSGELESHFLAVINLDRDRAGRVRAGHERVLRARFADAQFFWESDQKIKLGEYLAKLASVTYESRLGSYRDKVERMRALARWVAELWFNSGIHQADVPAVDRAAELAKCDLVTEMVREFTELQGIVGGLYAQAQGEPEDVGIAVYDHYRPASLEDAIPRNLTGCAVALADKLDSLVACFAVGAIPSGSSDPFALRRAAMGIVRILLERKVPLSLSAAISASAKILKTHKPNLDVAAEAERQVLDFLLDRARFILREKYGMAYDEVNAAIAAGADDLLETRRRVEALHAIRHTKNFMPLAVAFKRIRKILEQARAKSPGNGGKPPAIREELLCEPAEKALREAARRVGESAKLHKRAGRYREALEEISDLRPAVDTFFDEVLVMAEDENLRQNRLALLGELLREFSTIADFSEMAAEDGART
ncbi:MAG: glycine--tRNA ligase subunit beta [Candidatus Acidiferrales bacterium]